MDMIEGGASGLVAEGYERVQTWRSQRASGRPSIGSGTSTSLERLVVAGLPIVILAVVVADAVWRNPTEAAALGTAMAIGYVAYQSWHTRRTADAAVRGLVTAERSLRISQAMAAEAEKTRLDHRAPVVRVGIEAADWPPFRPRQYSEPNPENVTPYVPQAELPEGQVYRLPKNANDRIGFWAEGQVTNEGTLTIDVELRNLRVQMERQPMEPAKPADSGEAARPASDEPGSGQVPGQVIEMHGARVQELHIHAGPPGVPKAVKGNFPWSEPGAYRRPLQPGQTLWFRLQGDGLVSAWIANHRGLQDGRQPGTSPAQPLPAVISGEVRIDDGFDNGIKDAWPITLTGSPLEPVPDEDGSWQIPKVAPGPTPITAEVGRRRRSYWRSKERGLELPTPEV
jgi:hypothetical protein